jgi:hypothetical protein
LYETGEVQTWPAPPASDLTHPSMSLSMSQAAPDFAPSVPSHSSMSGHGWISDPLPSLATSQDSATHQLQVGGMSTTISSSDLQQRLHNPSFIVSISPLVFQPYLIFLQEQGHPTDTLADHQARSGRSRTLPAPQLLELHVEHTQSQAPSPSRAPSRASSTSTSAWSLASHYSDSSQLSNSKYIMRPGKDGINRTVLMRRRRTKDELVDRRGLTTADKNNIRLAQDIISLDVLTLNGFPNTEERSRMANEALSQAIVQSGKGTSNSSACA